MCMKENGKYFYFGIIFIIYRNIETNLMEGKGKMTFDEGTMYEGWWKDDERDGYGRLICEEGSFYDGQWKDSKR